MTQQKTKEEFPITRLLKKQANVMLIPLEGVGYRYRIRKGEQVIYLTTNHYGKGVELTYEGKKLGKRDLRMMLRRAYRNGHKFYWHTYILKDSNE